MKSVIAFAALSVALSSSLISSSASAAEVKPAGQPEVSTLEGQLVPVGNKNRYLTSYKTWNISTNPFGFVIGSYGASASYALNSNLALRADMAYFAPAGSDARGFEVGIAAPVYLNKAYQGLYLEPGVVLRRIREGGTEHFVRKDVGPQMLVGYSWMWDSGFNLALAAGMGRNFSTGDGQDKIFVNGYLRVGYAF